MLLFLYIFSFSVTYLDTFLLFSKTLTSINIVFRVYIQQYINY